MTQAYDDLVREVGETKDAVALAIAGLDQLKAKVDTLIAQGTGATDAQLSALATDLDAVQADIAVALTRDTP